MSKASPKEIEELLGYRPEPAPKPTTIEDDAAELEKGAKTPTPKGQMERIEALRRINDAFEFASIFFPDLAAMMYPWQVETLIQLSGYADPYEDADAPGNRLDPVKGNGLEMNIQAANGSGKDQIVLAIWALFCLCCRPNFYWIGTSATAQQLDEQTWKYIKERAELMNQQMWPKFITIRMHKLLCPQNNSLVKCFRSDQPGFTEGWHPHVPGGKMAIVLNEVKTLDPDIIMAFKRCHGWSHWICISSPGNAMGYFYERCTRSKNRRPERLQLGKPYLRVVTHADCPHLKAEYEKALEDFGAAHPWVRSSFGAEFISQGEFLLLTTEDLNYVPPKPQTFGMPRRAGVDWSDGGDGTVISIWEGNTFIKEVTLLERHAPTLVELVHHVLTSNNVPASQVYGDAGHSGATKIQLLGELGYQICGVFNHGRPHNKKAYARRGDELAWNFRRLVHARLLNLAKISDRLKTQCTNRAYELRDGKIKLEEKREYRGRVGYSPDQFDAAVLAHAGCNYHILRAAHNGLNKAPETPVDPLKEWNEIYGDTDTPNTGGYRTSGIQFRRARNAMSSFNKRLGHAYSSYYRR